MFDATFLVFRFFEKLATTVRQLDSQTRPFKSKFLIQRATARQPELWRVP